MNAIVYMEELRNDKVTDTDLLLAMMDLFGAKVGGMSGIREGKTYSSKWEWFDPFQLTSFDDVDDLPWYWAKLVSNMNSECWKCGYRYVHSPKEILVQYPRVPVKGIFAVTSKDATPETVKASDLIHLGDEFLDDCKTHLGTLEFNLTRNREKESNQ